MAGCGRRDDEVGQRSRPPIARPRHPGEGAKFAGMPMRARSRDPCQQAVKLASSSSGSAPGARSGFCRAVGQQNVGQQHGVHDRGAGDGEMPSGWVRGVDPAKPLLECHAALAEATSMPSRAAGRCRRARRFPGAADQAHAFQGDAATSDGRAANSASGDGEASAGGGAQRWRQPAVRRGSRIRGGQQLAVADDPLMPSCESVSTASRQFPSRAGGREAPAGSGAEQR